MEVLKEKQYSVLQANTLIVGNLDITSEPIFGINGGINLDHVSIILNADPVNTTELALVHDTEGNLAIQTATTTNRLLKPAGSIGAVQFNSDVDGVFTYNNNTLTIPSINTNQILQPNIRVGTTPAIQISQSDTVTFVQPTTNLSNLSTQSIELTGIYPQIITNSTLPQIYNLDIDLAVQLPQNSELWLGANARITQAGLNDRLTVASTIISKESKEIILNNLTYIVGGKEGDTRRVNSDLTVYVVGNVSVGGIYTNLTPGYVIQLESTLNGFDQFYYYNNQWNTGSTDWVATPIVDPNTPTLTNTILVGGSISITGTPSGSILTAPGNSVVANDYVDFGSDVILRVVKVVGDDIHFNGPVPTSTGAWYKQPKKKNNIITTNVNVIGSLTNTQTNVVTFANTKSQSFDITNGIDTPDTVYKLEFVGILENAIGTQITDPVVYYITKVPVLTTLTTSPDTDANITTPWSVEFDAPPIVGSAPIVTRVNDLQYVVSSGTNISVVNNVVSGVFGDLLDFWTDYRFSGEFLSVDGDSTLVEFDFKTVDRTPVLILVQASSTQLIYNILTYSGAITTDLTFSTTYHTVVSSNVTVVDSVGSSLVTYDVDTEPGEEYTITVNSISVVSGLPVTPLVHVLQVPAPTPVVISNGLNSFVTNTRVIATGNGLIRYKGVTTVVVAANTATNTNGRNWTWPAPVLPAGKWTVSVDGNAFATWDSKSLSGATWVVNI